MASVYTCFRSHPSKIEKHTFDNIDLTEKIDVFRSKCAKKFNIDETQLGIATITVFSCHNFYTAI